MSPRLLIASGIFHPESGGPATYLYEILPTLQERGWELQVISYGDDPRRDYPYPLTRIPRQNLPRRIISYRRKARPLLAWSELVYVHTLGLPLSGRTPRVYKIVGDQAWERAIRRGWIPPTTDIDAFQTTAYGPLVALQKQFRSRELQRAELIIVPSHYLKQMVMGWGVPEAKIHVIYNALPPADSELTQAEARAELGLDERPMLFTAVRLEPWKGGNHLINAVAQVPDLHLYIAGDGSMRQEWEQLAAQLQLEQRVHFLGRLAREQVEVYLKAADYFALYSGYEGLSHSILESLRAGIPVIASAKGGNAEIIEHDLNGLLVPYVNVEALTAALKTAFKPGKRAALAANSDAGITRFSFARMVAQTDGVLKNCLL